MLFVELICLFKVGLNLFRLALNNPEFTAVRDFVEFGFFDDLKQSFDVFK